MVTILNLSWPTVNAGVTPVLSENVQGWLANYLFIRCFKVPEGDIAGEFRYQLLVNLAVYFSTRQLPRLGVSTAPNHVQRCEEILPPW
ncbi:hypothetical protein [Mesorhizobium sp. 113-3-3]|uniref:hypothetical protein n=1 Tax=Mesorhizobium sp. 113-3-3 TaxID=2744516 RepID=UPI001FD5DE37|nr:hypothetical protein [Mesorhizobium sp. 113-3-3]